MRPIFYRFWLLTIISLLLSLSIGIINPQTSFALSWMDLLFRGVQVIQLSTISPQQEVAIGGQINQGLLESGKVKLSKDARINQYVQEIGQRLAATSDRPDLPYTFQVPASLPMKSAISSVVILSPNYAILPSPKDFSARRD